MFSGRFAVRSVRTRLGKRLAGVGLVLALAACGGDDAMLTTPPTPGPPTPAPPTPPPPSVVVEGTEDLTAPIGKGARIVKWDFRIPVTGTVHVTIEYLHDDSQVLAWVTDRPCNYWQFERDECFYLTKSLEGPRPRALVANGVRPGIYSLFVANDGPRDERLDYRVSLTPTSGGEGRLSNGR
jgi:hypothetical protein